MAISSNSEFYTANSSTITTDFNVAPYYDDFDSSKNYHRILFKPGYAVQARELTQIQSILQDQIQKFGQHLFKEGSKVLGGKFDIDKNVAYVKVKDYDSNGNRVNINDFVNQTVTGQTTGIQAYVSLVLDGNESSTDTKTLYVTYTSSNPTTNAAVFTTTETLVANTGTLVTLDSNATGVGSVFTINEGVRFAKQHFIHHSKQSVVIDRYGTSPTCQVGFLISESIINASQDASLLDPALESSNYYAPGADRFKLDPVLVRLDIDDETGAPDYVNLFEIRNGIVQELSERPVYNVIADEIAKRTSDESGDYYVRGLNVEILENLKVANNGGFLTLAEGGSASNLTVQIEPGLAYVKGYEVETKVSKYLTIPKGVAFNNVNQQVLSSRIGSYVEVKEFVGNPNLNGIQSILLYDTAQSRISNGIGSNGAQTGKVIGTARIKSVSYKNGTIGAPSGTLKLHIFDVQMNGTNSFANVRSVFARPSAGPNIAADIVLTGNNAVIQEALTSLVYYAGAPAIRKIRSADGTIDTSFTFKKTSNVSISSTSQFTITSALADEVFPYGITTLSDSDKTDIILTLNDSFNIAQPGTTTASVTGNKVQGNGSTRFTYLNVGDRISFSGNTKNYVIASIANNSEMVLTQAPPATLSGNTISKVYIAGDMIDLRGVGSSDGTTRLAVQTATDTLSFNLKEDFSTVRSATITYNMTKTSAREIAKVLNPSRYVKINVASAGTTSGPFNLGFSDVYKVKKIIKKSGSFPTSTTDGTDITRYFNLDSGQKDSYYGLATITPVSTTLASTDRLLVELDYFKPDFTTGVGYFSVDSYPINDTSPTSSQITTAEIPRYITESGAPLDLRNCLDFRPVYKSTAADATTVGAATENPGQATAVEFESGGLRYLADSEQIGYDYSYYIPRIDVVAVNKEGTFSIIEGTPSSTPSTPLVPTDLMSVARIAITPYPSIALNYARTINRTDLAVLTARSMNVRYTMRDIGVLKNRLDNLEQYVSLNLLEKSTLDLKVLDENGLDRFKNGIFADSFADNTLSAFFHPDHHICFDSREKSIRPLFDLQAIQYNYDPTSSTNVVRVGDYVMLPYTETTLIVQPYATTNRNVETTVYRFVGNIYLTPDKDFWISTKNLGKLVVAVGDQNPYYTPYSISYGSWQVTSGGQWQRVSGDWWNWGNWYTMSSALTSLGRDASIQYYYDNNTSSWVGGGGYLGTGYSSAPSVTEILGRSTRTTLGNYTGRAGFGWGGGISPSDLFSVITQSRNVTETFQEVITEYRSDGEKITSLAPIADIRPQTIAFQGKGFKANTVHNLFFDGQNMNMYVTPSNTAANLVQSLVPVSGQTTEDPPANRQFNFTPTGPEGSPLVSDSKGNIYGVLRLPSDGSKTFRTGTKEFILTDSITNEQDATSAGRTFFVAEGLQQTKQETIIATKKVITRTRSRTESSSTVLIYDRVSCMAYSFIPQCPQDEEGIFLTGFEVFFAAKDPSLGVWFEIREMDNSGGITRTQIPGSEVWLTSSQVNVSNDASAITTVRFNTPVFLQNNKEYALVVHTEAINPNYYMWVSVLGERDVKTGQPVNSRALTGSLFTTNNNLDWDIVPRTDLKVRFMRAQFNTSVVGQAAFGNEYFEKLTLNNVTAPFATFGEQISGRDRIKLSSATATPNVGTLLIGANTNVNTAIVSVSGTEYTMAGFGYRVGESVNIANANGTIIGTATVASKNVASGIVYDYNSSILGNKLDIRWSNGKFIQADTLTGLSSNITSNVVSIDDFVYSTVQFEPSYLQFNKNDITFTMRTTTNTGVFDGQQSIIPNVITDFDNEKRLYSRSNEVKNLNGEYSNRFYATMTTSSEYTSPVIDASKSYAVFVHNLVNSNTANELSPTGGELINHYLSQIVTLAEGQDAEDLRVIVSAYRPPSSNSEIKIWARYSNINDFEPISKRAWIPLEYYNAGVYSSLSNRNDIIEYSLNLPASVLTGTQDGVSNVAVYTNSANTTFTGFRQFQIKIGLQSDNSAVVPRVMDLRAIALQK